MDVISIVLQLLPYAACAFLIAACVKYLRSK